MTNEMIHSLFDVNRRIPCWALDAKIAWETFCRECPSDAEDLKNSVILRVMVIDIFTAGLNRRREPALLLAEAAGFSRDQTRVLYQIYCHIWWMEKNNAKTK